MSGYFKKIILSGICCCFAWIAQAQFDPVTEARNYAQHEDYKLAIASYSKLYDQSGQDADIYKEYLDVLLKAKEYKKAEQLVEQQLSAKQQHPILFVDLGRVYLAAGKEKKANEQFDRALNFIGGDDLLTTQMADAFKTIDQPAYAIKVYEKGIETIHAPFLYNKQLARLYAQTGDMDKALGALLYTGPQMPGTPDDTQSILLELLGNDPKKLQQAQKALVKRINEQPENNYYSEILTWLYTQKNDWEGALIQIQAIDERNKESGERVLEFARNAGQQQQYDVALQALDAIMEKGKDQPMYAAASAERLNVLISKLRNNPFYKQEDITQLTRSYEIFFNDYPQYYNTETLRDYAMVEAQYNDHPEKAIELLQKAVAQPGARREFAGWAKLQLGDYYVLAGKVWDASLTYSQVDKDFKEDMLGEEARFRNARLAYYRGDFEWAQGQLSVLKASTSELIANDALYLSILITENVTPDSNMVPLQRFAYADLLLFQNKDAEAIRVLDSIAAAFPKHPLNDDILMLRAKLAIKKRDYTLALTYLKQVYGQYDKDVLADDALFQTADIYERYLKQPDNARKFYEQLIIDYPGSTYVQTARVRLAALQTPGT